MYVQGDGKLCRSAKFETDCKTHIGRGCVFADPDKIRELVRRTPTKMDLAAVQALNYAIEKGRGNVVLYVTEEQYAALKR